MGREAYRRTGYVVVHGQGGDEVALLQVRNGLAGAAVLADHPRRAARRTRRGGLRPRPEVDLGVPSQVCRAALRGGPRRVGASIVQGMYEHVSFILDPDADPGTAGRGRAAVPAQAARSGPCACSR